MNCKGKRNPKKIQGVKLDSIWRQTTWDWLLVAICQVMLENHRNNECCEISYLMKSLNLSIPQCARGLSLSDQLKWDHRTRSWKCYLSKYYVIHIRFASGNYLLKLCKWNKENVIITFANYVRITFGSLVRSTFGSYVIKTWKWDQKIT